MFVEYYIFKMLEIWTYFGSVVDASVVNMALPPPLGLSVCSVLVAEALVVQLVCSVGCGKEK